MKLLYIVHQINGHTGLDRILTLKANYFIEHFNYEIVIITLNETRNEPFFECNSLIKFIHLPIKNGLLGKLSQFREVNKILKAEVPDIVVIPIDHIYGLYLPYFLNRNFPYVYERHNAKNVNVKQRSPSLKAKFSSRFKRILTDRGGKCFDKIVLLSEDHVQEWKYTDKIVVINNPLIFYPKNFSKLTNKRVLAVGRHSFQKGFDMLIKSWVKVIENHKDWHLDIYGNKDSRKVYIKLAEEYGISDYVTFHDPVKNIMDIYLESSIYVLSSRYEGFPLVLIETMSCGVPAVAFNCPYGVKEIIKHDEDGIIVEQENTDALAKSIIHLIENPDIRKNMGENARNNILRLSGENIFPKWKRLFEDLIN